MFLTTTCYNTSAFTIADKSPFPQWFCVQMKISFKRTPMQIYKNANMFVFV